MNDARNFPAKPKDAGSCDGCRYAQPIVTSNDALILECYRYPPTLLVLDDDVIQVHPDAVYRCGEYKKPPEEQVKDLTELLRKLKKDGESNDQRT